MNRRDGQGNDDLQTNQEARDIESLHGNYVDNRKPVNKTGICSENKNGLAAQHVSDICEGNYSKSRAR